MQSTTLFLVLLAVIPCFSQRPFYAGHRPIGFPDTVGFVDLSNRHVSELPAQLNGDLAYANRLDQLPESQQPIWYLNQQAYESGLKNPQTFPQRPSVFNENTV